MALSKSTSKPNPRKETPPGVRVSYVAPASAAHCAGLRGGDRVVAIDGERIEDELDFGFLTASESCEMAVLRRGREIVLDLVREPGELLGAEVQQKPISSCGNRCIFCFIDQLPPGLRKRLYIKDEDYRYSFLNGNYVTLCGAKDSELYRVARLGLSPLYISVHATDPHVRRAMLRNRHAGRILEQLRSLRDAGIQFHTQIVVCPGINDGLVLRKSINDLLRLGENLLSIAVVPVGLTKYSTSNLEPVRENTAKLICAMVDSLGDTDAVSHGHRRVFCSDELYIRAKLPIPSHRYYVDYPQIENGVGLVRQFMRSWGRARGTIKHGVAKQRTRRQGRHWLVVTSVNAYPFVSRVATRAAKKISGEHIRTVAVENYFFGTSVTVAGLLTAHDIIRSVREYREQCDIVMIPKVMLNYNGNTLDGYSVERLAKQIGRSVVAVDGVAGLMSALESKGTTFPCSKGVK